MGPDREVNSKEDEMGEVITAPEVQSRKVVNAEQWLAARKELLSKERELTHLRDEISRQRRELPWEKVGKQYVFDGPNGKETLADLFQGRGQLITYHFMLGPGWKEGCVGCSFHADHMDGAIPHLEHHDVSFVVVSRAPLAEIQTFQKRMGWKFKWVSSYETDFNYDYDVSFKEKSDKVYYNYQEQDFLSEEMSGISVFAHGAAGEVFHTYSSYSRGGDIFLGTYNYLDITPKGRNENGPNYSLADWVRHHDRYDAEGFVASTGRFVNAEDLKTACGCETEPS
jgi:predicted dithiol-disulfide oxidoreductase (DUF899 family)